VINPEATFWYVAISVCGGDDVDDVIMLLMLMMLMMSMVLLMLMLGFEHEHYCLLS
jgi:hypothetical protein